MSIFDRYAEYYDDFYRDKDYEVECDFIEEAIRCHTEDPPQTLLDVGCGTGGHALIMSRRGYEVTGVDRARSMLDIAKRKAEDCDRKLVLVDQDMRALNLNHCFDTVICMFAALSYQLTTAEILTTLRGFHRHLKPGGLLIADYLSGPAVFKDGPVARILETRSSKRRIVRLANPEGIDLIAQTNTTRYQVLVWEADKIIDELTETHRVRFLFPQEVIHYAEQAGFEVVQLCRFPDLRSTLSSSDWSAALIARASK
jgi:ubiquinone/menaquinone biosynthesis C-methylase UbiE